MSFNVSCDHVIVLCIHTGENEDYARSFNMSVFTSKTVANMSVRACISINITDDHHGEPLETFKVEIQSPDPRVSVNGDRIIVTIRDNESKSTHTSNIYFVYKNIILTDVIGLIPENFQVTDQRSRNITFSWTHSPQTNVSITGYSLNCSKPLTDVDQSSTTSIIEVDQNSTTAVVDGLTPFTNYSCYIYARVKGNRGELSTAVVSQTMEERKLCWQDYTN